MRYFKLNSSGMIDFGDDKHVFIESSPIGVLTKNGSAYLPLSASFDGKTANVRYACGECTLSIEECGKYYKIKVISVPDDSESFIFGPYATKATSFGEILGAGWYDDGAVSCIQSLMPKVAGGVKSNIQNDNTDKALTGLKTAAASYQGIVSLQCTVLNLSEEGVFDFNGMKNAIRSAVHGADGMIEEAAIALIGADSADELLEIISGMEIAEGMPHPTYKGCYAKIDRRVSSYYLIFSGAGMTDDERIELAKRAGINCVYFSDVFGSWGHFTLNEHAYPGGYQTLKKLSDKAAECDVTVGAHTLSNFIQTHDSFVTPIPHEKLLVMDKTTLVKDLGTADREIYISSENNYGKNNTLNALRIGNELINFKSYDSVRGCLTECTRGAYGTEKAEHKQGDVVERLWDHGYHTLFPNIELQSEMADNIANAIKKCGIRRLSFDGLEGCYYTGEGEYAVSEFVRRVYEKNGNDLVCDASITSHYLWHALSYANWGEPWYDDVRRGGMYNLRAGHIPYFKRNLIPLMMGWYCIYLNSGRYEATTPENMEFMLSRSAAFDAGLALSVDSSVVRSHGKFGEYLDMAKLWGDFRMRAKLSEEVRNELQRENSNWHLEKKESGWKLTSLTVRTRDLDYCDRVIKTEAGQIDHNVSEENVPSMRHHSSNVVTDVPIDDISEPFCFRIRVGEPGHGKMQNLEFRNLKFEFTADGGDYLVYNGGMDLYHYDKNFNLKEIIRSNVGEPVILSGLHFITMNYMTDEDETARYMLTEFRRNHEYMISERE